MDADKTTFIQGTSFLPMYVCVLKNDTWTWPTWIYFWFLFLLYYIPTLFSSWFIFMVLLSQTI
jgi:hypothetical protein